jgi:esterase/lipase superfamily enzyme
MKLKLDKPVRAVAVVLALIAGGWLFYTLLKSPSSALQRAETFPFRRATVSQLDEQGVHRHFVVTNRAADPDQADVYFSNKRDGELRFAAFDTSVEPSLGIGMLINRTDWFQNEEIQLLQTQSLPAEKFVAGLRQQVALSPYSAVLVVVHGFREEFSSALRKTAFLGHVLDVNAPLVVFDWPGDQGSNPRGYRRAHGIAAKSGAELAALLDLIVRDVQPARLWVLANSMGAAVVTSAFSDLYARPDWADKDTEIEDVVLTAPDVGADAFDEEFKPRIKALAKRLTVYVSANDRALIMSRIVNRGERRAGESTLSPDQWEEAEQVFELVEAGDPGLVLVDVTPVNRTRNFHNFSLETPEFFDDLFLRLLNDEDPRSRLLYRVSVDDGREYWVLTRSR